mgnify:CR=1 FL=1
MKRIFILLLFVLTLSSVVNAKNVMIRTQDIKEFRIIDNKKFYIVMKNNKCLELYSMPQMKAVQQMCFI